MRQKRKPAADAGGRGKCNLPRFAANAGFCSLPRFPRFAANAGNCSLPRFRVLRETRQTAFSAAAAGFYFCRICRKTKFVDMYNNIARCLIYTA